MMKMARTSPSVHKMEQKGVPTLARRRNWMERLADGMDLVGEPLPGQPLLELAGDRRVLIEHHQGVVQYCTNKICVRVGYGTVCICGAGLELSRMTAEQLVISGRIDQISVGRKEAR